jgi:hypothetical protein
MNHHGPFLHINLLNPATIRNPMNMLSPTHTPLSPNPAGAYSMNADDIPPTTIIEQAA